MSNTTHDSVVEWQVLNPDAACEQVVEVAATRLDRLDGKTIALFSNGKPGSDVVSDLVGQLLHERFEDLKLVRFPSHQNLSEEEIDRIAECDAMVGSIGD